MIAQKTVTTTEAIELDVKRITLLSIEEYETYREHIKRVNSSWWLRSPGYRDCEVTVIDAVGTSYRFGVYADYIRGIRPVLETNLKSSNLRTGDKIESMGYHWTVISDKLILCDEIIAELPFREDWKVEDTANDYNKSDVKQWLEDWYTKRTKNEDRREAIRILNEAIEALEREIENSQFETTESGDWGYTNTPTDTPTNSCVSKQQVIEAIEDVDWYHVNSKGELVSGATSVKESWYRAEDMYEALESLQPVTPPSKVLATIKVDTEELVERVKEECQLEQERGRLIDAERRES